MVKANRVNHHELGQIVLEGHIVTMPSHHIEDGVILLGHEEATLEFRNYLEVFLKEFISQSIFNLLLNVRWYLPFTSRSSNHATEVSKSLGLAKPLAPMGPKSGKTKWSS